MKNLVMMGALVGALTFSLFQMPLGESKLITTASDSDKVVFNTNSSKYHAASCSAAKKCTHCIEITRKEAKERGGVPCKLCGAGE